MVTVNKVSAASTVSEKLAQLFQQFSPIARKIAGGLGKLTGLEAAELENLSRSGRTTETVRTTSNKRGPEGIVNRETTERTETIDPAIHAEFLRKVSAPQIARAADRFDEGIIQVGNDEINLLNAARTLFEIFEAIEAPYYHKNDGEPEAASAPDANGNSKVDDTSTTETNPQPPESPELDLGPIGELVGGEHGLFTLLSTLKPETLGALVNIIQKVQAAKEVKVEGNNA